MIVKIITHIVLFAANLSLLSGVSQLFIKGCDRRNYNLFALFFSMGIMLYQLVAIMRGLVFSHPALLAFHITFICLTVTHLSFAYYLVILPEYPLPRKKLIYLTILIVPFLFDVIYLTMPESEKRNLLMQFAEGENPPMVIIMKSLFFLAAVKMKVYLFMLIKDIASIWKIRENTNIMAITFIYAMVTIAASFMTLTGYILVSMNLLTAGTALMGMIIIVTYIVGQRYPQFIQILRAEVEKKQYQRSLLETVDTDRIQAELMRLINEKKIFLDDEMTLPLLAEELEISPHQLSQFLNERLNMNFNSFINKHRVEEAKRLLLEEPERSILSVSYEVGFNSKSSFYEAFSRFSHCTPQQYRKLYQQ